MCLATPGTILRITDDHPLCRSAAVLFGSVERVVNVALVPEASAGDVVLVHAGIAISLMGNEEVDSLSALVSQAETADRSPLKEKEALC